uniref:Uncharacterized protein n=1 Tax=Arundo donax TaxID=35708 RepID=A0A0A9G3G1_ARUDO
MCYHVDCHLSHWQLPGAWHHHIRWFVTFWLLIMMKNIVIEYR